MALSLGWPIGGTVSRAGSATGDRQVLVIAIAIFVAITAASVLGLTGLWVFPPLLALAGA